MSFLIVNTFVKPIESYAANTYSKTFKDVSTENVNYDIIKTMAEQGIIGGYQDGTFRPGESISRKQAAVLISRAIPIMIKSNSWREMKDVTNGNSYYAPIKRLFEADLLQEKKGIIRPNDFLTRNEMAIILARAYGLTFNYVGVENPTKPFSDINSGFVTGLYVADVTTGYEDGTFRPNEPVTRAQFAIFMYRAEQARSEYLDLLYAIKTIKYGLYDDVPVPTNYKSAQELLKVQQKKYKAFAYNNNFDYRAGTLIHGVPMYDFGSQDLPQLEALFGIKAKKIVEIINHVFETGEVYTSPEDAPFPFAMYYDFTNKFLYYGSDIDPTTNLVTVFK